MAIEHELPVLAQDVFSRFMDLAFAPLRNQDMLWVAVPLAIATLFMTLYFGRNRREELGWNTAFGNTMVFLFVALNLIHEMYRQGGSWDSVISNDLYFSLSAGLAGASILLMFVTYFHLMPKRVAFFIFSAPPINVSVYVAMTIVYADVAPDILTVLAGVLLLLVIVILAKIIQLLVRFIGLEDKGEAVETGLEDIEKKALSMLGQKKKKSAAPKRPEPEDEPEAEG
jgi:hypothetical protein